MAIYRVLLEFTYDPVTPDWQPIPGAKATWVPGRTLEYPGSAFPTPIPINLLTVGKAKTLEKVS